MRGGVSRSTLDVAQSLAPAVVLAVVLAAAAVGCDDSGAAPTTTPSSSSTRPSDGATTPTSPGTTATTEATTGSPSVAPATGPELVVKTATAHAPEGWRASGSLIGTDQGALQPSTFNTLSLDDHVNLSGGSSSDLDAIYQAFLGVSKGLTDVTRLPDVSLAGTPALHVRYQSKDDRFVVTDMVTTVRADRSITLSFSLEPKTLRQQPELVDSVIASFAWR